MKKYFLITLLTFLVCGFACASTITTTVTKNGEKIVTENKSESSVGLKIIENKQWLSPLIVVCGFGVIFLTVVTRSARRSAPESQNSLDIRKSKSSTNIKFVSGTELFIFALGGVLVLFGGLLSITGVIFTATI